MRRNTYIVTSPDLGQIGETFTVKREAEAECKRYNRMADKLRHWGWERRCKAEVVKVGEGNV